MISIKVKGLLKNKIGFMKKNLNVIYYAKFYGKNMPHKDIYFYRFKMKAKYLTSLIAVPTFLLASNAINAATVFEDDQSRLDIIGRVKVDFANNDANEDRRMNQTARLGVYGKTKVNDYFGLYGKLLYDLSAHEEDNDGDYIKIRYGFLGFDFQDYGTLSFGRFENAYYKATSPTDLFLNWGDGGVAYWGLTPNDYGGRLDGQVLYDVNYQGFFFAASYQFKNESKQINYGYGATVGYEFEDVLNQPLGFMAGYGRYDGYESNDRYGYHDNGYFYGADKKEWAISAYWGTYTAPGFYLALVYNYGKLDHTYQGRGLEASAAYTTPNSDWTFMVTYGYLHNEDKSISRNDLSVLSSKWSSDIIYNLTSNFQIYSELEHRAKSVVLDESENAVLLGLIYNF